MDNDIYLTDLQLTPTGGLGVTLSGDLQLVSGIDNLRQALRMRLFTNQDEYLFGSYGSNVKSYVDTSLSPDRRRQVEQEIANTLVADTRVQAVTVNQVSQTQTGEIVADVTITTTAGDTLRLVVSSQIQT